MEIPDLAYLAGFFDGEGTVGCNLLKPCKESREITHRHKLRVSIVNLDRRPLDMCAAEFGGSVFAQKRYDGLDRRTLYRWVVSAKKAEAFLVAIRPYLRVKARQADIALALQARMGTVFGGPGGTRAVTVEEFQVREELRFALSAAKFDNPEGEDRGDT